MTLKRLSQLPLRELLLSVASVSEARLQKILWTLVELSLPLSLSGLLHLNFLPQQLGQKGMNLSEVTAMQLGDHTSDSSIRKSAMISDEDMMESTGWPQAFLSLNAGEEST